MIKAGLSKVIVSDHSRLALMIEHPTGGFLVMGSQQRKDRCSSQLLSNKPSKVDIWTFFQMSVMVNNVVILQRSSLKPSGSGSAAAPLTPAATRPCSSPQMLTFRRRLTPPPPLSDYLADCIMTASAVLSHTQSLRAALNGRPVGEL